MADLVKENGDSLEQGDSEEMTTILVGKIFARCVCESGRHILSILMYGQLAQGPMSRDSRRLPLTFPLIQMA